MKYFIVYMPGFIKKTLHHRCSRGFSIFLRFCIYQYSNYAKGYTRLLKIYCAIGAFGQDSEYSSSSEYGRVTQGSEQNAPL